MESNYIKWSTITLGLFLCINGLKAQLPGPSNNSISVNDTTLYEHGYNSSGSKPYETVDSVTIGSTMPYFVMPDEYYNKDYYLESDYKNTNKTTSEFEWTLNGATSADIKTSNPNSTGTSPWVHIKWMTLTTGSNPDMIRILEKPQIAGGAFTCEGTATEIPVWVINAPTATFGASNSGSECVETTTGSTIKTPFDYEFQVSTTTDVNDPNDLIVEYSMKKDDSPYLSTTTATLDSNSKLTINFTEVGEYVITLENITDRISRKSAVDGIIIDSSNDEHQYTFYVLPKPKAGKAYHISNNP